ncbi:serine/threonine-protein kinase [Rarobacter incanus]|uniref:non-specific serine/threonine protein kinase n=1 Tax=Rarobacter incanus TaxID=153494 RepID=A0A542SRX1_9MICO|nr:serine/threonine-protein kinase [Rarobacter incanus]TQK76997.1 serine/threonine protein kinase [Rarobacter incanus]
MAKRLPSAPPVLPGFAYISPLGVGGFADVFLYEQQMPHRKVAVKVLLRDVVDEAVSTMFNVEADVMAQLGSHPSIVTVYEASLSADGRPYIAMEYCPTVIGQIYRRQELSIAEVLRIGIKLSGALESAHRSGVLHRDVKPSNVMVTAYGAPQLADFGIASSLSGKPGVMALSVPWSAPEVVAQSTPGSVASEVWSLGATLYSLIAGHSPFEIPDSGKNTPELLARRVQHAKFTALARKDVPAELQGILAQTMQANPRRRQEAAGEVGEQLRAVQKSLGLAPTDMEVLRDQSGDYEPAAGDRDAGARTGVVRTRVDVASQRKPRTPTDALAPSDDIEDSPVGVPRGTVPRGVVLWGAAAIAALTGIVIVLLLAGR